MSCRRTDLNQNVELMRFTRFLMVLRSALFPFCAAVVWVMQSKLPACFQLSIKPSSLHGLALNNFQLRNASNCAFHMEKQWKRGPAGLRLLRVGRLAYNKKRWNYVECPDRAVFGPLKTCIRRFNQIVNGSGTCSSAFYAMCVANFAPFSPETSNSSTLINGKYYITIKTQATSNPKGPHGGRGKQKGNRCRSIFNLKTSEVVCSDARMKWNFLVLRSHNVMCCMAQKKELKLRVWRCLHTWCTIRLV